ncbi:MAG: ABC transporter permease, partial [Blautia sp.]|nr:ABC transporter permease [Blautia sp.]
FVRAPFLLEGALLGFFGSAIPLTILYFVYNKAVSFILTRFSMLSGSVSFIPAAEIYRVLIPLGLGLGIGIGFLGSFFTTRRHLQA